MAPTRPGAASFHLSANTDPPASPNRKQAGWAWQRRPPAARLPFAGARRRHAAAAAALHGEIEWPQPALAPPPSIPKQHPHIACPEPGLASQGRPRCWPWCLWAPPWCTSRRWLWLWLCGHACGRHRVWRAPACRLQQHGRPSRLLRPWACLELKGRHGCSPRHVAGSVNEPTSAGSTVRRPCWPASAVAGGRRVGVGGGGQRFSPYSRCRMPCNCLKVAHDS